MIGKKKHTRSLESIQQRAGYVFILPWAIGLVLFFIEPLFNSVWYSFNEVRIEPGRILNTFVGIENFKKILFVDPSYLNELMSTVSEVLYSIPLIISFSLIIAIVLNQKFIGRGFFRAIYFIPIIFTASAVMSILEGKIVQIPLYSQGDSSLDYFTVFFAQMEFPDWVMSFISFMLNFSMYVLQNSAVPIVLFLAGLQEIPTSLYEVSKIEGANKWEEFWLVTVPQLRHIITLVMIYTMIDLSGQMKNIVVSRARALMDGQEFGTSSAMLWFYFVIVLALIAVVYSLYNKFCIKKWE